MSYLEIHIKRMQFPDEPHIIRSGRLRKVLGLEEIKQRSILIQDIDLSVEKEGFVSFIGESGAGKTTLLRIIAGLERNYTGSVTLNGNEVLKPSRKIQIVFQHNCLLPWLTVEENMAFAIHGLSKDEQKPLIQKWLQNVKLDGTEETGEKFPRKLSGGQASRVAFARTFMDEPEVMLLDEPFRSIDMGTKFYLHNRLLEYAQKDNTTVLLVSHSLDDAVFLSDCIYRFSANPMRIVEKIPIPVPRPRQRGDPRLVEISTRLIQSLTQQENRDQLVAPDSAGGGVLE